MAQFDPTFIKQLPEMPLSQALEYYLSPEYVDLPRQDKLDLLHLLQQEAKSRGKVLGEMHYEVLEPPPRRLFASKSLPKPPA